MSSHHQLHPIGESSQFTNSGASYSYYNFSPVGRPDQSANSSAPTYDPAAYDFCTFFQENEGVQEEKSFDPLEFFVSSSNPATQQVLHPTDHDLRDIRIHLPGLINSPGLSDEQKIAVLSSFPSFVLDDLYEHFGPNRLCLASTSSNPDGLTEATYTPLISVNDSAPAPTAPQPVYPPYARLFTTAEQAKRHRRRSRVPAKSQAPDIERVKRYGRNSHFHPL
jgi:hypothetical protein